MIKALRSSIRKALANERAFMDNLVGTMIAVVMFGIVTISFSGIFMTYNVMTGKATENSSRLAVITTATQEAITNMYVDFYDGYLTAREKGWCVYTYDEVEVAPGQTSIHKLPLNQVEVEGMGPVQPVWADYTFAAQRDLNPSKSPHANNKCTQQLLISQWGWIDDDPMSAERGLVKLYTATPKAQSVGPNTVIHTCDWTVEWEQLKRNCIVSYDVVQSVYQPPIKYKYAINENWLDYANYFEWQDTDYSSDTMVSVATQKLSNTGVRIPAGAYINAAGRFPVNFILKAEGLQSDQQIGIDFVFSHSPDEFFTIYFPPCDPVDPSDPTYGDYTACRAEHELESTQYLHGSFTVDPDVLDRNPDGSIKEQSLIVYLDTDTTDGATDPDEIDTEKGKGPEIRISQFHIYQTLPQSIIPTPTPVSDIRWDESTYKAVWNIGSCVRGTLQHQYRIQIDSGPYGEWSSWTGMAETPVDMIQTGQTGQLEVRSRCYVNTADVSGTSSTVMSGLVTRP